MADKLHGRVGSKEDWEIFASYDERPDLTSSFENGKSYLIDSTGKKLSSRVVKGFVIEDSEHSPELAELEELVGDLSKIELKRYVVAVRYE